MAASRASPNSKLLLIMLNLVYMLCFDQPMASNLPPLLLSNIPLPFHWQSCRGSRSSPGRWRGQHRRRRRRCRRQCSSCMGSRGGSSNPSAPLLRARSHRRCWPWPGVVTGCETVLVVPDHPPSRLASKSQQPAPASEGVDIYTHLLA